MASARGDGHPLLLASRELGRIATGLHAQPDPIEKLAGAFFGRGGRLVLHVHGRFDDVLQGGQVTEKVETLEDHADLGPLGGQLVVAQVDEPAIVVTKAHEVTVDVDPTAGGWLEVVYAAQQGALAGA